MLPGLADRLPGLRHRYAEPHRAYHTQAHIDAMLRGLATEAKHIAHPEAVELAIWYHDAVYDPAAADNEARSATLLRTDFAAVADTAPVVLAAAMILASATHTLPPNLLPAWKGDTATFLDLDLAILGGNAAAYDGYEAGIGIEYVPVHGHAAFRRGRAAFLEATLTRERVFVTQLFHDTLDGPARANMNRALNTLRRCDRIA